MRKQLAGIAQVSRSLIRESELVERRVPGAVQLADGRRLPADIEVAEEDRPVRDDRTAYADPALPIVERADFRLEARVGRRRERADQALAAAEEVGRAVELVRPALGDRVDAAAREAA